MHIRQFFNFGKDNFVPLLSISEYLTRLPITTRQKVLAAFFAVLVMLYVKADSTEGRGIFCKLEPSEADKAMVKTASREIGKRKLSQFLAEITAMKTSLKIGKLYFKLRGIVANEITTKEKFLIIMRVIQRLLILL